MTSEAYFQGIGCLYGEITQNSESKWCIKMQGFVFSLFIPPNLYRGWLKQVKKDRDLYLRVYPRSLLLPKKEPQIYFQVVAWSKEIPKEDKPGIFVLKGIWQKIPQVRVPVLTIYRNKEAKDLLGLYKKNHIPCLMNRKDCAPFRYNLKAPKEIADRYFIQGLFKFLPEKQAFGFQKDLNAPTLSIPRYKISKVATTAKANN